MSSPGRSVSQFDNCWLQTQPPPEYIQKCFIYYPCRRLEPMSQRRINRRSFLKQGAAVVAAGVIGLSAGSMGSGLLSMRSSNSAVLSPALRVQSALGSGSLTSGDAAILRFLATLETLETDFWQQYNELGGIQDSEVPGGSGSQPYTAALEVLDSDMPQYIHDNTEDEFTHFTFIDAYLTSKGAQTVSLDQFRTLPGSKATGAQHIKRL